MSQFCYDYPRPNVCMDVVLFGYEEGELYVLLIKRLHDPFKDSWATPGGFLDEGETCEFGAIRELKEETNVEFNNVYQIGAFSEVERDPRSRNISISYFGCCKKKDIEFKAASDAKEVEWFNINNLPDLAFDHANIVSDSIKALRDKSKIHPIYLQFVNEKFNETDLDQVLKVIYEPVERSFYKKLLFSSSGYFEKVSNDDYQLKDKRGEGIFVYE